MTSVNLPKLMRSDMCGGWFGLGLNYVKRMGETWTWRVTDAATGQAREGEIQVSGGGSGSLRSVLHHECCGRRLKTKRPRRGGLLRWAKMKLGDRWDDLGHSWHFSSSSLPEDDRPKWSVIQMGESGDDPDDSGEIRVT